MSDDGERTREPPTLVRATPGSSAAGERPLKALEFAQRYHATAVLGTGGMGKVELVDDLTIGRAVAMKLLHREQRSPEAAERFLREARIQGQLEHPAVVPVYDIGVDPEGSVYFTMKRVRGTTLHDILEGLRKAPQEFAAKYSRRRLLGAFATVCLAVDFAHRHGVLHRDLKPANVMLGDFGEVYVLDWGLARVGESERAHGTEPIRLAGVGSAPTQSGVLMGTPGYMAPEQARGALDAMGPASDVYSLGAILFEILTRRPLHDQKDMNAVVASTLAGAEARPSIRAPAMDVAPELEAIVVAATAIEPGARFASARALHEAIERYLDGERNDELRAELATKHSEKAEQAVARARKGTSLGLFRDRRQALREIGRALALDPDNERALGLLMTLLGEPPTVLPPEVKSELDHADSEKVRWQAKIAGFAYFHFLVYLPILAWVGVRRWDWVAAMLVAALGASALSFYTATRPQPPTRMVLVVMVLSNVAMATTCAMFGPLFFMPAFIAVNVTGFTLYMDPVGRRIALATALAALLVPLGLWALGALPGGYEFTAAGLLIRPGSVMLERIPTLVVVTIGNLAAVITAALVVTQVRDALRQKERQLLLYAWQLREFVPLAAREGSKNA
jgi:eukaryotic-like serine/threonine-protein kinase